MKRKILILLFVVSIVAGMIVPNTAVSYTIVPITAVSIYLLYQILLTGEDNDFRTF